MREKRLGWLSKVSRELGSRLIKADAITAEMLAPRIYFGREIADPFHLGRFDPPLRILWR
jgi:hypothetical protein